MKQVLYFSAAWCGPCKAFKPLMESMQNEIPVTFIDVDTSPQTAAQYNVRSVPTTVVIQNGMEIGRAVGARTKEEIRAIYNR
jgi:thioredoxin-like negative regulator of GroEL